jgi:hypothetical protein
MSGLDAIFDLARADPAGAWSAAREHFDAQEPPGPQIDPAPSVALATVLAGAAARAVELCVGDAQDTDYQRRFGAVSAHASAAEMLARRDAGGLEAAAIARESMRYSWSAIELALRTAHSQELDALGQAALALLCDPLRPADEVLDRALARERLSA